jgi:hypothetical protein
MGIRQSVVSGLDGVKDVVVVIDPVVRGRMSRRKVTPSLLSRLGALSLRLVKAVARGVTAASPCW